MCLTGSSTLLILAKLYKNSSLFVARVNPVRNEHVFKY